MYNKSIISLSYQVYPSNDECELKKIFKYRIKFFFRALFCYPFFRKLQRGIPSYYLEKMTKIHLRFLEKPFRPYLHMGNGITKRTDLMIAHYQFLIEHLPEEMLQVLYQSAAGLDITEFDVGEDSYRVNLSYYSPNHKEGDLCLKLLDSDNKIFYSITFSVFDDLKFGRTIIVGGLQGPESTDDVKLRIRQFTKLHFGQRPKDLMVKFLTIIANVWDVQNLYLVSNKGHTYNSVRYVNDKIKTDYDKHWLSLGAKVHDKRLFKLDTQEVRKNLDEVKRSKRGMYRKRYAWLDELNTELSQRLAMK